MTDNKLWDKVIEPILEPELVLNLNGDKRGIKFSCTLESGLKKEVIENGSKNIGTNYKKARQKMIDEVRKAI